MAKKKAKKVKTKRAKKPKVWKWEKYIFAAARKTWRWSPARREALTAAKHGEFYRCNVCTKYVTEVAVDHIYPVVDPNTGFTTWDNYFNRLYCSIDNLQAICDNCHSTKSKQENLIRRENKKKVDK